MMNTVARLFLNENTPDFCSSTFGIETDAESRATWNYDITFQRSLLSLIVFWTLVSLSEARASAEPPTTLLRQYCVRCHGMDGEVNGEVNLLKLANQDDFLNHPNLLADLVRVIEDHEMPPDDEPQLSDSERKTLLAGLNASLAESLKTTAVPPRAPVRRMNRFQYANAVEDLLDLKVELFALPERVVREYDEYFQPASGKIPDTVRVGNRPLGKSQLIAPRLNGVAPFPPDRRAEDGFDNRGDRAALILKWPAASTRKPRVSSSVANVWSPAACWNVVFASCKSGAATTTDSHVATGTHTAT